MSSTLLLLLLTVVYWSCVLVSSFLPVSGPNPGLGLDVSAHGFNIFVMTTLVHYRSESLYLVLTRFSLYLTLSQKFLKFLKSEPCP